MLHEKNKNKYNVYNTKIIDLKDTKLITLYQNSVYSLREGNFTRKEPKHISELTDYEIQERERQRKKYYNIKKNEIANLIQVNKSKNSFFISLTYAKETSLNNFDNYMQDFKKFINRLNYYFYKTNKRKVKYIATWEYKTDEETNQTKHFHFHLWIDFPFNRKLYIKNETINKIWSHGFVNVQFLNNIEANKIGIYLTKYLTKDIDLKSNYRKSLLISRNLQKPQETKLLLDLRRNKNKNLQKMINENRDKLFIYNRYYKNKKDSKVGKLYLTNEEYKKHELDKL